MAPRVRLRAAIAADIDAIGRLHRRSAIAGYGHVFPPSSPPPSERDFIQRWRAPVTGESGWSVTVAEHIDEIVGVVMWGCAPDDPAIGHVARLYVDPNQWGDGVGRALHDHALDQLAGAGHSMATLWVLDGNVRARAWYERLGWVATGVSRPLRPSGEQLEAQLSRSTDDRRADEYG